MTKHEIEEAVNQGQCRLDLECGTDRVKIVLTGPDGVPVASGERAAAPGDGGDNRLSVVREALRDAYRDLFNETESRYSQKLCRTASIRAADGVRDALPLSYDGQGGAVLSEEAARLLDPLGNLRPGVPVTPFIGTEDEPLSGLV